MQHKLRFYTFIPLCFAFIAFMQSCKTSTGNSEKEISEGEIIYSITYPNVTGMMAAIYPDEMVMKFKDNKTFNDFSTSSGFVRIGAISDQDKKEFIQLFKLTLSKKMSTYNKDDINNLLATYPKFSIEQTKETKVIAGYTCKKAIVKFVDEKIPSFNLYYTNEIKIKNANWWSPFREIDGVLMEYEATKYNIDMKLIAKEVKAIPVDNKTFEAPADYATVSIGHLDSLINELNNN